MQDVRARYALIALIVAVLTVSGIGLYASRRPAPPPIVITQPLPVVSAPSTSPPVAPVPHTTPAAPPPKYYVHVAGAVKNPSLYLLPAGSRVMMAVKAAGGPTAKADLDSVNLAEKVRDGEKVYIPQKTPQTAAVMLAPPGNTLGHESALPSALPPTVSMTASATPAKVTKTTKGGVGKATKLTSPAQGQVNINTATADQLQRLPGIGPAMAARILTYRQQAGGFQKIDELQEISGIGPKKYAKLAPLVKLQ